MIPVARATHMTGQCKPRASGDDPDPLDSDDSAAAVNPARAGMIPPTHNVEQTYERKPRASGDDPNAPTLLVAGGT